MLSYYLEPINGKKVNHLTNSFIVCNIPGGSTENLLINARRPTHLQLPGSSSGDSLDVEIREREPAYARNRKSRSMVAPKHRMRSPVPAPRLTLQQPSEVRTLKHIRLDIEATPCRRQACTRRRVDIHWHINVSR